MLLRDCPPMLVNVAAGVDRARRSAPGPRPVAASVLAFGFQAVAAPLAAFSAAMWLRACPPMLMNPAAGVHRAPLTARAWTPSFAFGSKAVAAPRCRIQRGDAVSDEDLRAHAGEVAACVDRAPAHRNGVDPGAEGAAARIRVPGRGGAGCRIERGDVVARLPADAGEGAAARRPCPRSPPGRWT